MMGNTCCTGEDDHEAPPPTVTYPVTQEKNYGWNVENPYTGAPGRSAGQPDYTWRDSSFGSVPANAVRAGVDKSGEPIYVGRAFHEGDIVPAKIIQSHGGAYVPWGGEEHKKDHYEVICADNVSWQSDSNGSVPNHAVAIGTTRDGEKLFIGRVMHDGTLTPGKIQPSHGSCYIPYGGQELAFPEYEVLIIQ